jgi:hypothetical protein
MSDTLMAISLQRRCVAVAIFSDMKLERMEVRQLSHDSLRASTTVHRLIAGLLQAHPVQRAVLEVLPGDSSTRRADLARLAHTLLADRGIPVTRTNVADLRRAFSIPPCRTRKAVREIVARCWPALLPRFETPTVLDAAALGLHAQIQGYLDH